MLGKAEIIDVQNIPSRGCRHIDTHTYFFHTHDSPKLVVAVFFLLFWE